MTNAQIIFSEEQSLAKQGIINYTGRVFETEDGIEIKETESIHTYAGWQELGYQVQKGEKAVASFHIWKYVGKKDDEDEDKMFLKKSAFFKRSQVKEIEQ